MRALASLPRKRILVVDDEPDLLEFLHLRLDLAGYDPFRARSGEECLDCIANIRPDALIIDLNMPGMGGYGVLRTMQEDRLLATIPTMVLTGRNQADDVKQALALGAVTYLAKPFEDKLFLSRVRQLVKRRGATSAVKAVVYV